MALCWPAPLSAQRGGASEDDSLDEAEVQRDMLKDRIQPGDVVSIAIFPGEEYSREVTVQPDGRIQMALIGSLMVKGLTLSELQDRVRSRYSKFLDKPQVTANVRRFSGRRVAIIGQIKTPGYYDYRDGMKLLELVSMAGGLALDANGRSVRVLRPGASAKEDRSLNINFNKVLRGDLKRDAPLAPGDTVYVPEKRFTSGASWINRNILPWAIVTSIVTSIVVTTRK